MSKYIFSLIALISFSAFAQDLKVQDMDTVAEPQSVLPKEQRYGLRVGIDLNTLSRSFYDEGFRSIELTADYRLTKKIYFAGEIGNVDFNQVDNRLDFTTKGNYLKVGFDYNAYENWLDMENMVYAGVRYGFSAFNQNLNSYTVYQNSDVGSADDIGNYFDDVVVQSGQKYSGLSAHWLEFVGGVKAELFSNVFLGFSIRLKAKIADTKPSGFDNLYIPGFNRTYDGTFGAGFNYTLSYFIPLYKKASKTEAAAAKK